MKISGVIWDYDGTLVDTRMKNLNVTKAIISEIMSDIDIENSVLGSLENYEQANVKSSNWRELYRNEFGLTEKQIDNAGKLWTKFQLLDKTEVQLFEGISFTVPKLSTYSQGIVSQNSSENIKNNLERNDLAKYFNQIIGYEEVDFTKQKPNPEGLLKCISDITDQKNNGSVVYIGDHITDIECAQNANEKMGRKAVISILMKYNKLNLAEGWEYKPDYISDRPEDILEIIDKIINA
ncbi:MAG: HAD family hydrolase [Melioribacteraceae bacterium]